MQAAIKTQPASQPTIYRILFAISLVHLLNDTMQAVVPAIFPTLEQSMRLSYVQLGWLAFALNMTSSVMQPLVGWFTDKHPAPYMLPLGMGCSLIGMIGLAYAPSFPQLLLSVVFIGLGSAAFHPEGSRVAYMAAGGKRGLAQSIYQVGGNGGQSLAPLITVLIFVKFGQVGAVWFTGVAALAIIVLLYVSSWYNRQLAYFPRVKKATADRKISHERKKQVTFAILLLIFIVFARSWYHAGISNYYQFYLIKNYGLAVKEAQFYIFAFLASGVFGTLLGGPLADRIGRRNVLLFSMLGSAPLALVLPYVSMVWVYPIFILMGFILLSGFSVAVVYAQELIPGRVGMTSGLIVGLAFGMGALGAVVLGKLADVYGLPFIMMFCSVLPLLGTVAFLLPSDQKLKEWQHQSPEA